MTNICAQSVTFLGHKTSLTYDLGSDSSTKCRTAIASAATWHLTASNSSHRQRSIDIISYYKFLSNPGLLLYWTKSPRVSVCSTPNVSHASPESGPRKAILCICRFGHFLCGASNKILRLLVLPGHEAVGRWTLQCSPGRFTTRHDIHTLVAIHFL